MKQLTAEQVLQRRRALGLSRDTLAERLGVTRHVMWRIERRGPHEDEIEDLLRVLELGNRVEEGEREAEIRGPRPGEPEGWQRLEVHPEYGLICLPRFATARNPSRQTYGARVADIAEELGTPLMPWQRYVADVALEVDSETGRLVYRDVVLTVPRQSGKTTLLLAVMVQRALATQAFGGPQNINYTAQTRLDARKKWEDEHVNAITKSAFGELCRIRKAMAMEAILWRNGSKHAIIASTEKSGHGETVDLGVIDEAFAQSDFRLEQALKPAMQTRSQAQLWVVSTAGDRRSTFLRSKVDAGRELTQRSVDRGICYFEWSAEEGDDPASVDTWKRCMPALRHSDNPGGTTEIETVAADYASMELPEFKRAYLNLWDTRRGSGIISEADWGACLNRRSRVLDPVCLAFDVSPDHRSGAIAAAGASTLDPEVVHVEVVDHRSGTDWMVDRINELIERHQPSHVVCDAAGPAGSLLAPLTNRGHEITVVTTREHIHACGSLFEAITGRHSEDGEELTRRRPGIYHVGQPELNDAVSGADRRQVNDAWLWTRRSSNTDISPLVAVTLARYGFETAPVVEVETDPALSVW